MLCFPFGLSAYKYTQFILFYASRLRINVYSYSSDWTVSSIELFTFNFLNPKPKFIWFVGLLSVLCIHSTKYWESFIITTIYFYFILFDDFLNDAHKNTLFFLGYSQSFVCILSYNWIRKLSCEMYNMYKNWLSPVVWNKWIQYTFYERKGTSFECLKAKSSPNFLKWNKATMRFSWSNYTIRFVSNWKFQTTSSSFFFLVDRFICV